MKWVPADQLVKGKPVLDWWKYDVKEICINCRKLGKGPKYQVSGVVLRNTGIATVNAHTPKFWRYSADAAIRYLCDECLLNRRANFTAEDVRVICGDPPNHPNAMGARFSAWTRAGLIERDALGNSQRPTSHAALMIYYVPTATYTATHP
jgi:hypothetical protein